MNIPSPVKRRSHRLARVGIHAIWSTKHRIPFLAAEIRLGLFPYMSGILRRSNGTLLAGGGWVDHIHLYIEMPPTIGLSLLVSTIKSNSTRWIRQNFPDVNAIGWQQGYAAFSVDRRRDDGLMAYILNQDQIHKNRSATRELTLLFRAYHIQDTGTPFD